VASPKVSISHQQSKKAAKVMNKITVSENAEKITTPNTVEKILVALDGSEKSIEALDFALNLITKLGAEMELLTVTQNTVYPWIGPVEGIPVTGNPSYMKDFYKKQEQYSNNIVNEAKKRVMKIDPNTKVSTKVLEGAPATKIIEESENGFDLIIMGSRGHGFIDELILGSVSKRVMDDSRIPVLVVK
jgi:nucleotide-binding universal stress UspA family protein